jgi:hypothetical protein
MAIFVVIWRLVARLGQARCYPWLAWSLRSLPLGRLRYPDQSPETPFRRLMQRDDVCREDKAAVRGAISKTRSDAAPKTYPRCAGCSDGFQSKYHAAPLSEDMQKFVSSLAIAWNSGEERPTHRREPRPGRWYRTRKDPFAEVWPVLLGWLEEKPDIEAKEMLKRLQASGYGNYSDGQLRTLQRRVREWRTRMARDLIYGYGQDSVEVETGAGEKESFPSSNAAD